MFIVKQILSNKGHDVWSVSPETTIYEALELMAEKNIGAVPVFDGDSLVGIFSERDYARRVVLEGKSSRKTPISEGMTGSVICVSPEKSVQGCMALMSDKRIRHLPVLHEDRVIGIISIGDVVKALLSQQETTIRHLEDYITTGYPEVARADPEAE